jgi:hypothetical protein
MSKTGDKKKKAGLGAEISPGVKERMDVQARECASEAVQ